MTAIRSNQAKITQLKQMFERKYEQQIFNGTILVALQGEIVYFDSYGWECYEKQMPLTSQSRYELASITKPITALAIQTLIQQCKLREDDLLQTWLPELPYSEVKISHLLNHTSGLPDYMELLEQHWDQDKIATNQDALRLIAQYAPAIYFTAGSQFSYSNTAYMCLASIIEKASGYCYADYMKRFVFEPLGMNSSEVINRRLQPHMTENHYAFGYIRTEDQQLCLPDELPDFNYVRYLDGIQGDGTVHATALDLLKLDQVLRAGQFIPYEQRPLIVNEGVCNNTVINGWFAHNSSSHGLVLSHSGGWPGYATRMCRYMDNGYTIILLCNAEPQDYSQLVERPEDWQLQIEQLLMTE